MTTNFIGKVAAEPIQFPTALHQHERDEIVNKLAEYDSVSIDDLFDFIASTREDAFYRFEGGIPANLTNEAQRFYLATYYPAFASDIDIVAKILFANRRAEYATAVFCCGHAVTPNTDTLLAMIHEHMRHYKALARLDANNLDDLVAHAPDALKAIIDGTIKATTEYDVFEFAKAWIRFNIRFIAHDLQDPQPEVRAKRSSDEDTDCGGMDYQP